MSEFTLTLSFICLLLLTLATGLWVAVALAVVGVLVILASTGTSPGAVFATVVWGSSTSWTLIAMPLFILMGEILFRTRIAEEMFEGLAPWVTRLPGRLMHVNVLGCGIFAAVSGSSLATSATIGRMSLPELEKRGYDSSLAVGTLAGSGTIGLMIPPSIIMIVYGASAQQSIPELFIGGIFPGLLLVALFMGYVALVAVLRPATVPPNDLHLSFRAKLYRLRHFLPVVALIVAVIGSIYTGLATATEAAAVGVIGALGLAALSGSLSFASVSVSVMEAMKTSSMIGLILAAASFMAVAVDYAGITNALTSAIVSMDFSAGQLITILTIVFIVMGCFLDGISIVVLVSSILLPVVKAADIDMIWFGIYLVLVVEMSLVTPPVGMNLFVLQGISGRSLVFVARAALPFFFLLVFATILIWYMPELVTYLPSKMVK